MNKKVIIITAAAGLVSFGGVFTITWLTRKPSQTQVNEPIQTAPVIEETELKLPQPDLIATGAIGLDRKVMKQEMTAKQLQNLIYDIRGKRQEYEDRLEALTVREQRLQTAHEIIREDIEKLNNLLSELALTVRYLKDQRGKLLKSRVEIESTERINLQTIAAAYDKMDTAKAGKILTNMSKMQNGLGGTCLDDVVKILYFTTEKTKAKILAELVDYEPQFAALLCQKLKQVVEE